MTNSSRNLPWLAGAVVACAVLAAPAARAQTTTTLSLTPTSTAGSTGVKGVGGQQAVLIGDPTMVALPSYTAPESIVISSGTASLTDNVSVDLAGGLAVDELIVDLRNCVLKGAKSLAVYSTTGFARITRQLLASDSYVGTLPVWITSAAGVRTYYTITFTINTTHNTTTNVLTGASLALGNYVAPATAGGTAIGGTIQ